MRDIYFKDTNVIWHTKWSSWAPLSLYKHFLSLAEFPAICPAPKTTVSTVRGTEINLWLLWVPYNINSSVLVELLCPCVVAVSATKFHKAFHSCLPFLSSCNTSLHHSFQTPPLLVSQLFDWHAAAYFSQLCLLCPVVLRTLFLFHVSIFRMAQWCIYLLSLTSLTSYRFLFIHSYMTVRACKITLFCMCRSWMHMIWMIDYDFKRIAVHLADKQMAVQLFPSWVVVKYLQVMTHLSMRNLRSNNNIPQNLLFSEKNNFRKAVCTPVSMSQIQLNKILAKNWIILKWSTGTCHCPHDDSCLPERKIWV